MNYLIRFTATDSSVRRRSVPASSQALIVDADLAGHLLRRYPCHREDATDVEYVRRHGVGAMKTVMVQAREHHLVGGQLVAWDHIHNRAYSPALAPESWPLPESGWPVVPKPMDMTATVLGSRILVELVDDYAFGRRWVDATVIGTPEALQMADGSVLPMSARCVQLHGGDLPGGSFDIAANGTFWKRRPGVVEILGKRGSDIVTLADLEFTTPGPGRVLLERDGAWKPLGDLA